MAGMAIIHFYEMVMDLIEVLFSKINVYLLGSFEKLTPFIFNHKPNKSFSIMDYI